MSAYFPAEVPSPTEEEIALLVGLADEGSLLAEQIHLRRAAERAAALEERARLARDLHDSVTQALFSLSLHAQSAARALTRLGGVRQAVAAQADITAVADLGTSALREMRALIFELRPEALTEAGLVHALRRHVDRLSSHTSARLEVTGPDQRLSLPAHTEEQAYRIGIEALNNAAYHAEATLVSLTVIDLGDQVLLTITDDGTGFDPTATFDGHFGLHTMRERAAAIGGEFELSSTIGLGTTILLTIPTDASCRHA